MKSGLVKALTVLFCAWLLSSCSLVQKEIDLQRQSLEELKAQLNALNDEISAMQLFVNEIQNSGYAVTVSPISEDGDEKLLVVFKDGRRVVLSSGRIGIDGSLSGCMIGVREDNDVWYWTISGEWLLLPDGSRAIAVGKDGYVGVTPKLQIVDGWWELSMDGGISWERMVEAKGEDGYTFFQSVDLSSQEYVALTLFDGTVLLISRYRPLEINLKVPDGKCLIAPGETLSVPYSIGGTVPDNLLIVAGGDGRYNVLVKQIGKTEGELQITCPEQYQNGYVFLMADDRSGNTVLKVIEFDERIINWEGEPVYKVGQNGGLVSVSFMSNFDAVLHFVDGCEGWINRVDAKSLTPGTFNLYVEPNNTDGIRVGRIMVAPASNPSSFFTAITIVQACEKATIDNPVIDVNSEGGEFRVTIETSDELSVSPLTESERVWIDYEVTEERSGLWYLDVKVHKNRQFDTRNATLFLFDGTGATKLGAIIIFQHAWSSERRNDMILTCRANISNDFTIYLPLRGQTDCMVDWGDGSTERIERRLEGDDWVFHRYSYDQPRSYTISVSGSVEVLNSTGIPSTSGIVSIEQWGRLGLKSMAYAFEGYSRLTFLPPDMNGAFREVTSFDWAFADCGSLTDISENLFADCPLVTSLSAVFRHCSSLASLPEKMFSGCTNVRNMQNVFWDCSSLASLPSNLFYGCSALTNIGGMFQSCPSLKQIPEDLFAFCPELLSLGSAFEESGLEAIPERLFYNNHKVTTFRRTFRGTKINSIPSSLFAKCPEVTDFSHCFNLCRLKDIPVSLFDSNRKVFNFSYVFASYYDRKFDYFSNSMEYYGESPYTIIDGEKVHLYERISYPDFFFAPTEYDGCFGTGESFSDSIPYPWAHYKTI